MILCVGGFQGGKGRLRCGGWGRLIDGCLCWRFLRGAALRGLLCFGYLLLFVHDNGTGIVEVGYLHNDLV